LILARRATPRLRLIECLDLSPLIADISRLYRVIGESDNRAETPAVAGACAIPRSPDHSITRFFFILLAARSSDQRSSRVAPAHN
jgi:hypothetical protein